MLRVLVLAVVLCCSGCFGPFRMTGGMDDGKPKAWKPALEEAREVVLHRARELAASSDLPAVLAMVAVHAADDRTERASIIWRDETLPDHYGNGSDRQRNEDERLNWLERERAVLRRDAAKVITETREAKP